MKHQSQISDFSIFGLSSNTVESCVEYSISATPECRELTFQVREAARNQLYPYGSITITESESFYMELNRDLFLQYGGYPSSAAVRRP